jgi:hypothetical protein
VTRFREFVVLFLVLAFSAAECRAGNRQDSVGSGAGPVKEDLKLIASGEEVMSSGRRGAFRIYVTSDGTRATVSYASFNSLQDAQHQFELWSKIAKKVMQKEGNKDQDGRVTGQRTVATTKDKTASGDWFLIIRRVGLNCYFVRSLSLPVAIEVENLIQD